MKPRFLNPPRVNPCVFITWAVDTLRVDFGLWPFPDNGVNDYEKLKKNKIRVTSKEWSEYLVVREVFEIAHADLISKIPRSVRKKSGI